MFDDKNRHKKHTKNIPKSLNFDSEEEKENETPDSQENSSIEFFSSCSDYRSFETPHKNKNLNAAKKIHSEEILSFQKLQSNFKAKFNKSHSSSQHTSL